LLVLIIVVGISVPGYSWDVLAIGYAPYLQYLTAANKPLGKSEENLGHRLSALIAPNSHSVLR